jgi:N-acetylneuraminic acid mutarotase
MNLKTVHLWWSRRWAQAVLAAALAVCLLSPVASQLLAGDDAPSNVASVEFPDLPEGITSFGAAVSDGNLYVYGGATGQAHEYSTKSQSDRFLRLNLARPQRWEELKGEARLQGLALVAHGGKLYRIGGFSAKNAEGEEHDLWSVADVARFDPATGYWEKLPPLPEPRSSHDAVVLGDQIYVAGGWAMMGKSAESKWHTSAVVLDLSQKSLAWQPLPEPPFRRRALSLATLGGRVYAIGGMLEEGGPTTEVHYYDPTAKSWHAAADLPGTEMEGFGNSAFEAGGRLFVSTVEGNIQQWDGEKWTLAAKAEFPRFFHRMLPLSASELLLVGGGSRMGKVLAVETVKLNASTK